MSKQKSVIKNRKGNISIYVGKISNTITLDKNAWNIKENKWGTQITTKQK